MKWIAMFYLFLQSFSLYGAVPLTSPHMQDVQMVSWYLIIAGFLAELFIMYVLLAHRESITKIVGATVFMNVISVFMSSVTVFAVETTLALFPAPGLLNFALAYLASVVTSVASEVLIVQKLFPYVDRVRLIAWLSLANIVSIGAGMYAVWMTRIS